MTIAPTPRTGFKPLLIARLAVAAAGVAGGLYVLAGAGGCASSAANASDVARVRQEAAQRKIDEQQAASLPPGQGSAKPEPSPTAKTHFAAGQVAEEQGDLDRAIEQYKAAIAVEPGYQPALFRLGMAQAAGRQYDAAVATWRRYVTATGGSAAAYADLGFCLDLAGRSADAETAFRAGVSTDPKNAACRTNYGLMLARGGKLDAAAAQLSAVLAPAEVQYDLASVLEGQGNRDAAKARYKKAIELDPNMADAKVRLANIE